MCKQKLPLSILYTDVLSGFIKWWKNCSKFYKGFTFSLVLWLIWCSSKDMRPLNILAGIPGEITQLAVINSVFSMHVPAYSIRPTDGINKCTNTDVIHYKKHIYYTHSYSSQICAWTRDAAQDSEPWVSTLHYLGASLHKTCPWCYVTPSTSQHATAVSPVTLSS